LQSFTSLKTALLVVASGKTRVNFRENDKSNSKLTENVGGLPQTPVILGKLKQSRVAWGAPFCFIAIKPWQVNVSQVLQTASAAGDGTPETARCFSKTPSGIFVTASFRVYLDCVPLLLKANFFM